MLNQSCSLMLFLIYQHSLERSEVPTVDVALFYTVFKSYFSREKALLPALVLAVSRYIYMTKTQRVRSAVSELSNLSQTPVLIRFHTSLHPHRFYIPHHNSSVRLPETMRGQFFHCEPLLRTTQKTCLKEQFIQK